MESGWLSNGHTRASKISIARGVQFDNPTDKEENIAHSHSHGFVILNLLNRVLHWMFWCKSVGCRRKRKNPKYFVVIYWFSIHCWEWSFLCFIISLCHNASENGPTILSKWLEMLQNVACPGCLCLPILCSRSICRGTVA